MTQMGGCHCGAIRYTVEGEPEHSALCHCGDCTRSAGAPMVGWAMFPVDQVSIVGTPVTYRSSPPVARLFCGACGTGLFYTNGMAFPGMIDIQISTFDDPDAFPPGAHIQVAEAARWESEAHKLPRFDRFPG
ncbi:GFA family protein [soil metagenome]